MLGRDSVWVWLAEKRRPGVIIEVEPDRIRIAYGTTVVHDWPHVAVHPDTRTGRAFPLREETYFYGSNTIWRVPSAVERGLRPVPVDLVVALRRLIDRYAETID